MQWKLWLRVLLAILSICGVLCVAVVVMPPNPAGPAAEPGPPVEIRPDAGPDQNLGLPDDFAEVDAATNDALFPMPFAAEGDENLERHQSANARLYRAAVKVSTASKPVGQQFPAMFQETGDCVSQGFCNAYKLRLSVQVASGRPQRVIDPFPPYTYGATRVLVDGPKLPCRRAGAYPSSAIKAFREFGVVTAEEAGVPYSGRLADDWGCNGPPARLIALGKQRTGDAYPIRSAAEAAAALDNGYPLTLSTNWRPDAGREIDGRIVCRRGGNWAHQMAVIGFDGAVSDNLDRKYFLIWNSHGAQAHKKPLGDEPQGSFWVTWPEFEKICRSSTLYAINDATGFPADDLDWSLFDRLKE
ncbi:hypothetical protein Plim_2121 [Planctopirus limnophila DSM 3776]|uniref:Uncharacterized protein n=1 Tax=Planctopirus limnophila (strain ATCC 43296 / DSM 3776 / IFAM 1008 / Mu 290) TaxID=521674 RepID=D5SMP3_PLAL2|nr:hypothetical protein [Planctopirus limnophila]ADG67948.1 hypothetical protein Plim_2121 [Planctopirus limnophila DSM 3776]